MLMLMYWLHLPDFRKSYPYQ